MAGTDRRRPPVLGGPAVILVQPQLAENIGATARAMLNFGLTDLRLVRPPRNWLNDRARAMASRADPVLEEARVCEDIRDAVGDLQHLFATTARGRDLLKPLATPRHAAGEMRRLIGLGDSVGVLFGGERTGLLNEDLVLAGTMVTIPLNPAFASLNLAQAVLVIAYEWFQTAVEGPAEVMQTGRTRIANRAELIGLFEHLERELESAGYFENIADKRPSMVQNIRNSLQRGPLLEQDIRTLRGIIKVLAGRKRAGNRGRIGEDPPETAASPRIPPESA